MVDGRRSMSDDRPARLAQGPLGEGAGAELPASTPSVGGGDTPAAPAQPRCKPVNRAPMTWAAIDVERLVRPDHLVRAIWEWVGRLDLNRFWAETKAVEGVAGCRPYDPRLLISLWVLAYSDAIRSARKVARRCEYHPAYQGLTGMTEISPRTLSGFRVEYQQELDELFAQVRAEAESTDPAECRASETEPEGRKMKQTVGGGFAPSYGGTPPAIILCPCRARKNCSSGSASKSRLGALLQAKDSMTATGSV